tara:strand:- start:29223 stop:29399 length:177 start_codon:yes stop_codon:yes gene_type:complete
MINYILENRESLISVATAVVAAASAICALTPTPKDDGIVRKLYLVLEWAALNVGKAKK